MRKLLLTVLACCILSICVSPASGENDYLRMKALFREEAVRALQNPSFTQANSETDTGNEQNATETPAPDQEIVPLEHEKKAYTLMVYLCGSNLETDGGQASADIYEMLLSGFNSQEINVLVLTGGSQRWLIPDIPADKKSAWEIHPEIYAEQINQNSSDNMTTEQMLSVVLNSIRSAMLPATKDNATSMGDPQTLKDFLCFSHAYYPADNYGLILWDHGGGPNRGVCMDEMFNQDLISIPELTEALQNSPFADEPLEWIGFDACLMGSAETASKLIPYAGFMIASEETEPGTGWDYSFINGLSADTSGDETGKRIIDLYIDDLIHTYNSNDLAATLSCIDLSVMDKTCSACELVFQEVDQLLTTDNYVEIAKARENAIHFGHVEGNRNAVDYDLMDINSFLDNLTIGTPALRDELIKALHGSVAYSRSTIDRAGGLSIYYPYFSANVFPYFINDYESLSVSGAYTSFIKHAVDLQTGAAQADWSGMNTGMPHIGNKDYRTLLQLDLTESQARLLAEAKLQVFRLEDNAYSLVSDVPDVIFQEESNTLSAEYIHRALFITDEDNNLLSAALPYTRDKNGLYTVEAELTSHDNAGNETLRRQVLISLKKAASGDDVDIVSIQGWDNLLQCYSPRYGITLSDYDTIEIVCQQKTPAEFANGTLLAWEEWPVVNEKKYCCAINKGEKLVLLHNRINPAELCASFAIRDYQNHRFLSGLLPLEEKPEETEIRVQYDDNNILTLSSPKVSVIDNQDSVSAVLSMEVKSIAADEILIDVGQVMVNQQSTQLETYVNGNGPNWGLLNEETQRLILNIPASVLTGMESLDQIDFILSVQYPDNGTDLQIPVKVILSKPL